MINRMKKKNVNTSFRKFKKNVHKLNLKTNMHVHLQNDASSDGFVKQ